MKIKKYFLALVLVSALSGFSADPVSPSGADTNVVVLTEAQYSAFTNDIGRIVSSISNVVQAIDFQVSMIPHNTNSISNIQSSVSSLHSSFDEFMTLFKLSGSPTQKLNLSSLNNGGTISAPNQGLSNLGKALSMIANNVLGSVYAIRVFTAGNTSAYDASTYNFIELFKLIDTLSQDLSDFQDDCRSYFSDVLNILDSSFYEMLNDTVYALNKVRTELLPLIVDVAQAGTNQLQTIIYIISNRFDQVRTNTLDSSQFDALTNYLDGISDGLSNIAPGGGDPSSPGGGSSSVDLSYFDRWVKEWVDRYFYPADSDFTLEYKYGVLQSAYPDLGGRLVSFEIPYLGLHRNGYDPLHDLPLVSLDSPEWWSPFYNTSQAYNTGHTNYYDVVSALLTDIQSVNAQNYALFYVLATNILLQSADSVVSETQQDVNSLEAKIESYSSDVETMKTDLEYKFTSLKNKYEDIKEKSDQIFSYLGGLALLPQQDYYFDLPKLQFGEDLEFGGMEITLPLTNQHLVMVAEILRFFSICLYWGLFLSMLYFAALGVVKMFLLLFKFMIYMGAIGTDK